MEPGVFDHFRNSRFQFSFRLAGQIISAERLPSASYSPIACGVFPAPGGSHSMAARSSFVVRML